MRGDKHTTITITTWIRCYLCYFYFMQSTGRITTELKQLMANSYDVCRSCQTKLPKDIAGYAGYSKEGNPLYVGECCVRLINELATHVYWWWEVDKRCDPATPLWRYMDFARFMSLLESRSLYFARADTFDDPFEGASGAAQMRPVWDTHFLDFFRQAILTVPGQKSRPSPETVEEEATRLLDDLSRMAEMERRRCYVSCWHANTGESEALWRLYCPPPMPGVAIRTETHLLEQALGADSEIKIGRVQYVDFNKAFAGQHDRIFWKRKSLSHESEVRAVIKLYPEGAATGLLKPVDMDVLLTAIVPSPFAPGWFPPLLEAMLKRFGISVLVGRSELLSQPFF